MFSSENQMLVRAFAMFILESKGQHKSCSHFLQRLRQLFNNLCLPFVRPQARKLSAQRVSSFFSKERIHVPLYRFIVQAHIHAVVIEEENTIAAPMLQYRVDEPE